MKILLILALLLIPAMYGETLAQTANNLAADWDKQHISNILPSNMRHQDLKKYLEQLKKLDLKVEEVGRSYARARNLSGRIR